MLSKHSKKAAATKETKWHGEEDAMPATTTCRFLRGLLFRFQQIILTNPYCQSELVQGALLRTPGTESNNIKHLHVETSKNTHTHTLKPNT